MKIEVGQTWRSLDPREKTRFVTIVALTDEFVQIRRVGGGHRSKVGRDRFAQAFELSEDVPA